MKLCAHPQGQVAKNGGGQRVRLWLTDLVSQARCFVAQHARRAEPCGVGWVWLASGTARGLPPDSGGTLEPFKSSVNLTMMGSNTPVTLDLGKWDRVSQSSFLHLVGGAEVPHTPTHCRNRVAIAKPIVVKEDTANLCKSLGMDTDAYPSGPIVPKRFVCCADAATCHILHPLARVTLARETFFANAPIKWGSNSKRASMTTLSSAGSPQTPGRRNTGWVTYGVPSHAATFLGVATDPLHPFISQTGGAGDGDGDEDEEAAAAISVC